jgi:hypothetical protein
MRWSTESRDGGAALRFPDVSADPELIERLSVRLALEEQDERDQQVCVAHLLNRFHPPRLREPL